MVWNKDPFIGDKHEGNYRNGKKEGKGIYYWNDGNIMKVILEMTNNKRKEFIIIIMVIDMKVNGEMIKNKEKELIIIIIYRSKGDYLNGNPIGMQKRLTKNGEVKKEYY